MSRIANISQLTCQERRKGLPDDAETDNKYEKQQGQHIGPTIHGVTFPLNSKTDASHTGFIPETNGAAT